MKKFIHVVSTLAIFSWSAWAQNNAVGSTNHPVAPSGHRPNILFIIMDDVGIDQLRSFGYGGPDAPRTPSLDAIARAGLKFRNAWSMPECTPSRAIFFEGRYPLRTNVYNALVDDDLANSQVSPFEVTTPKLLKAHNYENAMFGKFHLAGPDHNPYGNGTPHSLGWDYFDGFIEGAPYPIDTTAGGVAAMSSMNGEGSYSCGFVPNANYANGADVGACYHAEGSCAVLTATKEQPTPGRSCLESGGIFDPNKSCEATPPSYLNFQRANGYYVWNHSINKPDGTIVEFPRTDPRSRGYEAETITRAAEEWINKENGQNKSWMATLSFPQDHTPYQQPPTFLLPKHEVDSTGFSCIGDQPQNIAALRVLSNQMIESMDKEIADLMVHTGLATYNSDGTLNYHPENTNTMVVIISDNGTFAPGVKPPFDPNRAKGYVNQTGVWVPLIVAGPLVNGPGREVTAMVNIADLFELFGEIAGIDVHKEVPESHRLDSQAMLPYLINPGQPEIRQTNFTQTGNNIHLNNQQPPPCVIPLTNPPTCVQIFTNQGVCEYEGGDWYGPGAEQQYSSCCAVQTAHIYDDMQILPDYQMATRDDKFKLIHKLAPDCSNPGSETAVNEFFEINEKAPLPKIDRDQDNLCDSSGCPSGLNQEQRASYTKLLANLQAILNSEPVSGKLLRGPILPVIALRKWAESPFGDAPNRSETTGPAKPAPMEKHRMISWKFCRG